MINIFFTVFDIEVKVFLFGAADSCRPLPKIKNIPPNKNKISRIDKNDTIGTVTALTIEIVFSIQILITNDEAKPPRKTIFGLRVPAADCIITTMLSIFRIKSKNIMVIKLDISFSMYTI